MKKIVSLLLTLLIVLVFTISASAISIDNNAELSAVTFSEHVSSPQTPQNSGSRVIILPEDFGDGTGYPDTTYSKSYRTSNNSFYFLLVVTDLGNGKFRYAADAWWITPPTHREIDSIAIAIQNCSLNYESCSGWYSYNEEIKISKNDPSPKNETYSISLSKNNFSRCIYGDWQGYGVLWDLPENKTPTLDAWAYFTYTDLKIHIEFEANVCYPTQESYFNVIASYLHSETKYSVTPTLSFADNKGQLAISIRENTTAVPVYLELDSAIHYTP